jgi:hypothetical protein
MKISDPTFKGMTHRKLKTIAEQTLAGIISRSDSKEELLFKLAGFYGEIVSKIRETPHHNK